MLNKSIIGADRSGTALVVKLNPMRWSDYARRRWNRFENDIASLILNCAK